MTSLSQKSINNSLTRANANEIFNFILASGNYETVSVKPTGQTYTAPKNGYYVAHNANQNGGGALLFNANRNFGMTGACIAGIVDGVAFCPCKEGDTVIMKYNGTFGTQYGYFRFVYAESET